MWGAYPANFANAPHRSRANHGAQISYRGETENIEEGKTCRVQLSADDDGGQGGAITKSSGHSSKLLLAVAVVVGAATAIGGAEAVSGKQGSLESPDHP